MNYVPAAVFAPLELRLSCEQFLPGPNCGVQDEVSLLWYNQPIIVIVELEGLSTMGKGPKYFWPKFSDFSNFMYTCVADSICDGM